MPYLYIWKPRKRQQMRIMWDISGLNPRWGNQKAIYFCDMQELQPIEPHKKLTVRILLAWAFLAT